jgi:XTP/dITP diphosphohydrolase
MELLLATHNSHKKEEISKLLPSRFSLKSLTDYQLFDDINETGLTFEENAKIKADYGFLKTSVPCFSDDSGLVVEALHDEPGIYSARYSGTGNSQDNIDKVLAKLEGITNRKAYFICVIAFTTKNETRFFEGKVYGEILNQQVGKDGFGYDPIFKPLGYEKTFSEMTSEEKNKISHRALAMKKFIEFLENI